MKSVCPENVVTQLGTKSSVHTKVIRIAATTQQHVNKLFKKGKRPCNDNNKVEKIDHCGLSQVYCQKLPTNKLNPKANYGDKNVASKSPLKILFK